MSETEKLLREIVKDADSRYELWISFLRSVNVKTMVELGVFKGNFAGQILRCCNSVEKYYMLDPWRHLQDWNKPANKSDQTFEQIFAQAKATTDFAAEKRIILRGKTTEVIENIADGELDFAYIDGDHTLRGIAIDLMRVYQKVKVGGWIGGDDFSKTIWQHATKFEPTFVFPFAVYFAEAVGDRIFALPNSQFLIEKSASEVFEFIDLTESYGDVGLKEQLRMGNVFKVWLAEALPVFKKKNR
mgnify:CR=1 FL=1